MDNVHNETVAVARIDSTLTAHSDRTQDAENSSSDNETNILDEVNAFLNDVNAFT